MDPDIYKYHFVSQGKIEIPNVDDSEEAKLTDVSNQPEFNEYIKQCPIIMSVWKNAVQPITVQAHTLTLVTRHFEAARSLKFVSEQFIRSSEEIHALYYARLLFQWIITTFDSSHLFNLLIYH